MSPSGQQLFVVRCLTLLAHQGDVLDANSHITDTFCADFSLPVRAKYKKDLYACSLDKAPGSIENERE